MSSSVKLKWTQHGHDRYTSDVGGWTLTRFNRNWQVRHWRGTSWAVSKTLAAAKRKALWFEKQLQIPLSFSAQG